MGGSLTNSTKNGDYALRPLPSDRFSTDIIEEHFNKTTKNFNLSGKIFVQNTQVVNSLKKDFRVGPKLGSGQQGEVRLCKRRDNSGALRAVKIADREGLD